MFLTEERRASLLAYCKLTEFGDDQEVLALLEGFYGAAEGYMAQAGISPPPEGSARRAQYDLCINYLVLNSWDNRDMTYVSTVVADNPVFRRMMNQLKLTEPRNVSRDCSMTASSGHAQSDPARPFDMAVAGSPDTSTGEEVQPDGETSESGGAADGGDLPADGPDIG